MVDLSDDEADRQLLAESQASQASQEDRPPMSSAEESAALLNAARASRATAAPERVPGKLKRPSFKRVKLPRYSLDAAGQRKNVFDMSLSPEEEAAPEPQKTTSRKLPGVPGKSRPATEKTGQAEPFSDAPPGPLHRKQTAAKAQNNEQPPETNEQPQETNEQPQETNDSGRRSGRLAGAIADVSGVNWEKRVERDASGTPRSKRKAETSESDSLRPTKLSRGSAAPSHPQVVIPAQRPSKPSSRVSREPSRIAQAFAQPAVDEPVQDTALPRIEEEPPRPPTPQRGRANKAEQRAQPAAVKTKATPMPDSDRPLPSTEHSTLPVEISHQQREHQKTKPGAETYSVRPRGNEIKPSDTWQPLDDAIESTEEDSVQDEDVDDEDLSDFDRVMVFITRSDKEKPCQTKHGMRIKKACNRACKFVQDSATSQDSAAEDIATVLKMVAEKISRKNLPDDRETQMVFKGDAFDSLFASLAGLWTVVHSWASDQFDDPLQSYPALRIIVPLMADILMFKSRITAWNVKLPQTFQGGRLVKDVEEWFLVPFRKIEAEHRLSLARLEKAEQAEKALQELRATRLAKQEEQRRKAEADELLRQRTARWRKLHEARLKCEADPLKRRHLLYKSFREVEERDANGDRIERVDVFGARSTPVVHRASASDLQPWTPEQDAILLEGLQQFAGPHVFEKIFKKYCTRHGPSQYGPLRKFNVTEITAEAALARTNIMERLRREDWPVPDWLVQIPILP